MEAGPKGPTIRGHSDTALPTPVPPHKGVSFYPNQADSKQAFRPILLPALNLPHNSNRNCSMNKERQRNI